MFLLQKCMQAQQILRPTQDEFNAVHLFSTNLPNFGTCFTANFRGKQYLITARHLLPATIKNGDTLQYKVFERLWKSYNSQVYLHADSTIDLAVIKSPGGDLGYNSFEIFSDTTVNKGKDILTIGCDFFFLGYPMGISYKWDSLKYPLYKRCVLSATIDISRFLDVYDGHNNAGFSGGPIVAYAEPQKKNYVFAVVSGRIIETYKHGAKEITENSGIIIAYNSYGIRSIIESNRL